MRPHGRACSRLLIMRRRMRWLPWRWLRLRSIQSRFDSLLIDVIQHRLGTSHPAAPAGPKATSAIRVDASAATGRGQQPAPKAPVEDILGLAIQTAREEAARNQEGGALDLEDVLAQAKTFLFAGHGGWARACVRPAAAPSACNSASLMQRPPASRHVHFCCLRRHHGHHRRVCRV